ncbi:Golgi transport complex subunit 5-domain-containing protein [Lactarius akahatsu]|uniref:Conserved oligomeric Golgi complex subunit 5 n=1 Tax=Lactarius akahatsu TaxID=416441 RepID=A0AAD4QEH5_9AGAM|nr:Golgi transport complex subunit 5-domain-containing protein [Lactarius akahatsu]
MTDYAIFATSEFDPNEYANTILAGEPYPPQPGSSRPTKITGLEPAKEDISVAIAKLNYGIDDVSKQIKNVVTTHHEDLLEQAAGVGELSGSLQTVREGLDALDSSLEKLRQKFRNPYQTMQASVKRLQRLQQVSDVLRRTSRFTTLAKRLQTQMTELGDGANGAGAQPKAPPSSAVLDGRRSATPGLDYEGERERLLAQAAVTIAELGDLLEISPDEPTAISEEAPPVDAGPSSSRHIPLRSINAVAMYIPFIDLARTKVTANMESMVLEGLSQVNQPLLATSLQTAHNLRLLPDLVQNLVSDLSTAVEARIKAAFDVSQISKELNAKDPTSSSAGLAYKSRVRQEPTNVTAPQWANALWNRLSSLIEDMAGACVKVYTLEKVLKLKKDPVSQIVFLDEAMKVLENKPSSTFWAALARSLEKQTRDGAKNSTFLQQTLSSGYPKLLRLFHEFFSKIAVHTDTVYTQARQSPETILVLRALSTFEALYLSRVSNKMNEAVGQAFQGGARAPPSSAEGTNVVRTIANELDTAKFDPLLVQSVTRSAKSSLDMLLARADGMVVRDRAVTLLAGPAATPQLVHNLSLATFLYHCGRLRALEEEYSSDVYAILRPAVVDATETYGRIVDPLLTAIKSESSGIIAKLHREPARSADPLSDMGGSSAYVQELTEKLSSVKTEILARLGSTEGVAREWPLDIVRHVLRAFVLHVSIVKPLDEARKLQLTGDMTELEFSLGTFVSEGKGKRSGGLDAAGAEYRALRALRPLLFLETARLAERGATAGLPPLVVLHHILVRAPIPLPHMLHGWQAPEYVRWVEEHSEAEALTLVEGGLAHWEKTNEMEDADGDPVAEYLALARSVLTSARKT